MNWSDIELIEENILKGNDYILPQRSPEIQQQYEKHKQKYPNLADYIKKTYLFDSDYVFIPNNFPYDLQSEIKHYVFWYTQKWYNAELKKSNSIHNQIKDVIGKFVSSKFICFQNYQSKQSVPELGHYHVFYI